MWSLAIRTLVADRGKLITALVGVVFSVVLVNVQGGLFLGLLQKAELLVANSKADIWIGHKKMHDVESPRDIPRRWTQRIRSTPGVKKASPYVVGFSQMSLPSGGFEGVVVIGVSPRGFIGNAWNLVEGPHDAIRMTDGIVVDVNEAAKLESPQIGEVREIGGKRARVVGKTDGVMGFIVAPYVFTSYERASSYLRKDPNVCSYILVQADPGTDLGALCATIRERLPSAEVMTSREYGSVAVNFWMTRTGLGLSFGASTLLGLLVGMVMVAQTLYAMVLDRLVEFATLKAVGATESQVRTILFVQSTVMAIVGAILGLVITSVVQKTCSYPMSPILVPWWLALGSAILVLVICWGSSILPYLRIRRVDPLIVLQG